MAQTKGNSNSTKKKASSKATTKKKADSKKSVSSSNVKSGASIRKKSASKSSKPSAAERKKTAAVFDVESKSKEKNKAPSDKENPLQERPEKGSKEEGTSVEQNDKDVHSNNNQNHDEDISWSQQTSSILFGILSLFMFALIIFEGDHLWTIMHNFIFGIFGNMAILWNVLLVYSGYMFAKQKGTLKILEIVRSAAGLLIFIDVLNYITIQSNGYRNQDDELTYGIFQLIGQIYSDGSKLGGTGLLGGLIGEIFRFLFGKTGAIIITALIILAFTMLISHTTPVALFGRIKDKISDFAENISLVINEYTDNISNREHFEDEFETDEIEYTTEPEFDLKNDEIFVETKTDFKPEDDGFNEVSNTARPKPEKKIMEKDLDENIEELINKASSKTKKKTKAEEIEEQREEFAKQVVSSDKAENEYKYPTIKLLIAPKNSDENDDKQELKEMADMLINTLDEYGVKASISDISRGPTVTRYEVKPAPGVKINKITNLSNDIALRLAAQSIRIEAPIPGKPAVGIEIPNQNKQMVRIREIIGSQQFREAKGALTVALGRNIEGNIVLCDLSKMPHLLIAGSTGSGKSVCVNSMLISLLYKYSPKEVRMVLIDPKSVEFDMYNGIPHLLVPVVCEPKKAAGALQWAVSEMLKRYGMLKEHGARNIDNYNKIAEEIGEFEKLCRIVIVIDEMADLMIASPKEVEDAIARLAAMARAAGMYMVLATQRPSVDVITGTIKNNIPSRIALAVSSQIDSRTILDEGGAENLIGYGDMLYHPMGTSKHIRVQGCFVDDGEVERVINFVKQNGSAEYDDNIADEIERNSLENSGDNSTDFSDKDELFMKAVEIVTEAGQASTSMLQRRLSVGYARAGRLIDQLEENGIIGPYEGSKPRTVLITHAQWLEMTMSKIPSGKNDPIVRSHSQFAAQTLDNGHEEITARQSEFFNAKEIDDDDSSADIESISKREDDATPKIRDFSEFFDEDDSTNESDNDSSNKEEVETVENTESYDNIEEIDTATKTESSHNVEKDVLKTRDFSEFFDDELELKEKILFSTNDEKKTDDDLPPWDTDENLSDEKSDDKVSMTKPIFNDDNEEDDDFYDNILSAPWVIKLNDKK